MIINFDQDSIAIAKYLLGKVVCHKVNGIWLKAMITETEAYYINEKGSHASLGFSPSRKALFMPPGTIYMYYARGRDSFNISTQGDGNAVLIKSAIPFGNDPETLKLMKSMNLTVHGTERLEKNLCAGQTLFCKALGLKVRDWNQKKFDVQNLFIEDVGYCPQKIVAAPRKGIPKGRDEHLLYRFFDSDPPGDKPSFEHKSKT